MNDGPQRKRGIFSYLLPYLLIATSIGFLIFLILSNINNSDTWSLSNLDTYLGVSYNVGENKMDALSISYADYVQRGHEVRNFTVSQGYKAVTVSGSYRTANNQMVNFNVLIEEDAWNQDFSYLYYNKTTNQEVATTHASYKSLFAYRLEQSKQNAVTENEANQIGSSVADAFTVSWWDTWGPTIIMTGASVILVFLLMARLGAMGGGGNGGGVMNFNKSPARRADNTKVRFGDVAGCDAEKAEMVELVEYLKDPKKYTKVGARLPKGVLLMGPPGTGKTLLAKAVAGEAGVPFYSISGSDFVEMYVGVGAGRVRDLFRNAKATAPCLIFIDEIDAVGRQRGAGLGGGNDEREQTLNQLLVEMDGFEANSGILVIAATNRDDVLDPALRRAGRFDRSITVSLPDKAGRKAIFEVHARNKNIDAGVDFEALAKRTTGFSGADIDNVLNEAAILAVRAGKESIGLPEIDEAIDRRIAGPAKSGRTMSELERKQVAYHEAGHAVIGLNLPFSDKVQKITIVPRGNTGGHVLMTPEDDRFLLTKNQLIARITGLLGGRVSEEIFFQDVSTGASNDIQEATRIARMMVTELGMSDLGPIQYERDTGSVFLGRDYASTQKNFSTQIAFEIDKAVRQIIDEAHDRARALLEEKRDQVVKVAEKLLEQETITAEEIASVIQEKPVAEEPVPAAE